MTGSRLGHIATCIILIILFLYALSPTRLAEAQHLESGELSDFTTPVHSLYPFKIGDLYNMATKISGQVSDNQLDVIGDLLGNYFGQWVNAKVIYDISWIKLIFCFFILLVVVIIERLLRNVLDRYRKNTPHDALQLNLRQHFVDAMARPVSLLVWIYGIYAAVTPILISFRSTDGTNFVYDIAQRATDLGAVIALVWFFVRSVAIIDTRLRKRAADTGNKVDDMLAPLVGKTLRIFI